MSNDLVVKSNVLVEAGYQLTTNEQRLILSAIACIPKGQSVNPNVGYCVSKRDFVKLGVNPKTAHREIREACDRLFNRYVTIKSEQGEFKTRWVQDITKFDQDWALANPYNFVVFTDAELEEIKEEGYILASLTFSRSVIPFLSDLTSNFTRYLLSDVSGFGSSYSFRFYEFIMQFQSTGYVKISIEKLRDRLELGDKYPATKDLKVRVIDIAIQDINKHSPYKVEYNLIKTGKKFTHLELKFKEKPTKKTKENESRDPNTVDMLAPIKITDKQRQTFASKLAELSELGGYAPVGMSMKEYAQKIESDLLDPQKAEFYRPYLEKLGFKA